MSIEALSQRADIWRGGQTPPAITQTLSSGYSKLDPLLNNNGWPVGELIEIYNDESNDQESHTNMRNNMRNNMRKTTRNNTHNNIGHLKLLMPALAQLSQHSGAQRRWIAMIAPPHIPYAPALRDHGIDLDSVLLIHPKKDQSNDKSKHRLKNELKNELWAAEQALASNTCSAVLMWIHGAKDRDLRRLSLAAQRGNTLGVLFPAPSAINNPSPASLRIATRCTYKPNEAGVGADNTGTENFEITLIKQRGTDMGKKIVISDASEDNNLHLQRLKQRIGNRITRGMSFDINRPGFSFSHNMADTRNITDYQHAQ